MTCKDCPYSRDPDWMSDAPNGFFYCPVNGRHVHRDEHCIVVNLVYAAKFWKTKYQNERHRFKIRTDEDRAIRKELIAVAEKWKAMVETSSPTNYLMEWARQLSDLRFGIAARDREIESVKQENAVLEKRLYRAEVDNVKLKKKKRDMAMGIRVLRAEINKRDRHYVKGAKSDNDQTNN